MIASVRGEVIERGDAHVVVETGGVGLSLRVSTETLKSIPEVGQSVRLLSEMLVRDDSITLYGFSTVEEQELFRLLITVSGVGPKVAISALSTSTPRRLAGAVLEGDPALFVNVPGIGRRTAERVIVELRGKVKGILAAGTASAIDRSKRAEPLELARAGLMGLGYDSSEADGLLTKVDGATAEELIAAALRRAGHERSAR